MGIHFLVLGEDPKALIGLAIVEGLQGASWGGGWDGKVVPFKGNHVIKVGHGDM